MKIKSSEPMGIIPSGKFLTRIARKKFWEEDRPYKECEEFVLSCVECNSDKERAEIRSEIYDVIMGSKRLEGKEVYETVTEENVTETDMETSFRNLIMSA